jgi:hypothetical protein
VDKTKPTPNEANYEKLNAKARNILFPGIRKEVFNRVHSHKNVNDLWDKLVEMHEGSKDEREEHHKVVMDKINAFKMLPHENSNQMFSRLNILVEELNDLGLSKMSDIDIIRRILGALPNEKYANIVAYFHQVDLDKYKIAQILGKISGHEMYMGFVHDEGTPLPRKMILHSRQPKRRK